MIPQHPLVGDLSDKTVDELSEAIAGLNKKLAFAGRINNPVMIQQLHMILASYRAEYNRKQDEIWNKVKPETEGKIDIS